MGAPDVLAHLSAIGVRLQREGDSLIAEPRSALTDAARAMIRAHKAELLEALKGSAAPAGAKPRTVASSSAAPEAANGRPVAEGMAGTGPLSAEAMEARRKRVVALLAADSTRRLAVVCDSSGDPVPVAIAIRGKGTCEVQIPATRFDPFKLLELVARHGGTLH